MARILLADTPEGTANLEGILAPGHALSPVHEIRTALEMLRQQTFELIILGVRFDDSQMFDLLQEIPQIENCAGTPIICVCTRDTPMTRTLHESLEISAVALGVWMYIDQLEYDLNSDSDAEIGRLIQRCLINDARKKTLAERKKIQVRREDIHRLRQALESEVWTLELEDKLGDLRQRLSKLLLELFQTHLVAAERNEEIETSRNLEDHVSGSVTASENELTVRERKRWRNETEQSMSEQEIVDREETKGKKGRREAVTTAALKRQKGSNKGEN